MFTSLFERLSVPVIIVDIQPAYSKYCGRLVPKLMNFLNSRKGKILCFYNGRSLGLDSEEGLVDYYLDSGLNEDTLRGIKFIDKGYGFFRGWMDNDISRGNIIRAIRYMVLRGVRNSRDIPEEEWIPVFGDDWDEEFTDIPETVRNEPLYLPDISIAYLKTFSGCYLLGGARDECLAELRLLMDAFNINYKLMRDFIY